MIHDVEVAIGVFIGAVTFTGSIVAFLKLSARIKSAPLMLPGRNWINLGAIAAFFVLTVVYVVMPADETMARRAVLVLLITAVALALGWHLVASIGGGDMPVVVSMLNSYSGWAAAAAGFLLGNDLLIITGALVGSSGAYLSYIMCRAMNRVVHLGHRGGFGVEAGTVAADVDCESTARSPPRVPPRADRCPQRGDHARVRHGRRPGAVPGGRPDPESCASAASA